MSKYQCFVDLDGVLVDFATGACKLHGHDAAELIRSGKWKSGKEGWDFNKSALCLTDTDFYTTMDHTFWESLSPTRECFQILQVLENSLGAENISLLSSPTLHPGSWSGKAVWVAAHLPKYRRRLFVGANKPAMAHPNAILVDDSDANVDAFRAKGGRAILYPRHWNSNHDKQDFALKYLEAWLPVK